MKESLKTKLLRIIRERRIKAIKWIIRKAVRKLDVLQYEGFLAYSWGYNEEIDYHVLKERSTKGFYQYGTRTGGEVGMIWFLIGFVIGGLLFLHHCEKHPVDQHEIEVRDILREEKKRDRQMEKKYKYTTAGIFEEAETFNGK